MTVNIETLEAPDGSTPEAEIEKLLAWMRRSRPIRRSVPLDRFGDAEPLIESYMKSVRGDGDTALLRDIITLLDEQVFPSDVDAPIDVTTITHVLKKSGTHISVEAFDEMYPNMSETELAAWSSEHWNRTSFALQRIRQLTGARRRLPRLYFPVTVEMLSAIVENNGTHTSMSHFYGLSGKSWKYAGSEHGYFPDNHWYAEEPLSSIDMAYRTAFARRYTWQVSLGYEGTPSILFSTDPTGVREVFRLRDLPEGKQRRQALRHWVAEHWRKRRSDPSSETHVRKHFRGVERFTWNGLRCKVIPSAYDCDVAARAARK